VDRDRSEVKAQSTHDQARAPPPIDIV
jgi:hypothetical protein